MMSWLDASEDILVVEDEPAIADVVSLYLQREGWSVRTVRDGEQAMAAIAERLPALVILDLRLPKVHGLKILQHLRSLAGSNVLVIILTDQNQEQDRIRGLEMGADDYVAKPFSTAELLARVRAILRRTRTGKTGGQLEKQLLQYGGLIVDPGSRSVTVYGKDVKLTLTEFDLLHFLARHPRQVFTLDQLIDRVWGYDASTDNSTVYVHIRRLREKIESEPKHPVWLHTVWGMGYKFEYNGDSHT